MRFEDPFHSFIPQTVLYTAMTVFNLWFFDDFGVFFKKIWGLFGVQEHSTQLYMSHFFHNENVNCAFDR